MYFQLFTYRTVVQTDYNNWYVYWQYSIYVYTFIVKQKCKTNQKHAGKIKYCWLLKSNYYANLPCILFWTNNLHTLSEYSISPKDIITKKTTVEFSLLFCEKVSCYFLILLVLLLLLDTVGLNKNTQKTYLINFVYKYIINLEVFFWHL